MIDLLIELLRETKTGRWLARGLVVLLLFGIPGPFMWSVQYLTNREVGTVCTAMKPTIARIGAQAKTPVHAAPAAFHCPRIRLTP